MRSRKLQYIAVGCGIGVSQKNLAQTIPACIGTSQDGWRRLKRDGIDGIKLRPDFTRNVTSRWLACSTLWCLGATGAARQERGYSRDPAVKTVTSLG